MSAGLPAGLAQTWDEFNGVTRGSDGNVRPIVARTFHSFSQAAAENGQSRIYLGIHWAFDKTEGIRSGKRVANFVFNNFLRPRTVAGAVVPEAPFSLAAGAPAVAGPPVLSGPFAVVPMQQEVPGLETRAVQPGADQPIANWVGPAQARPADDSDFSDLLVPEMGS